MEEFKIILDPTQLRPRARPLLVGVGVHFGIDGEYGYDPIRTARALAETGFDSFRDDIPWQGFDKVGIPPKLAEFMNHVDAQPLLILTALNRKLQGGPVPLDDAGRSAFGDFGARSTRLAVKHKPAMVEVGNEWNLTAARGRVRFVDEGAPDDPRSAVNYAPLARTSIPMIRSASPDTKIFVGAAGPDPSWQWVLGIVKRGALTGADGLSVHVYNQCEANPLDRTGIQASLQIDRLKETLVPAAITKMPPLYITEVGWPTSTSCPITREAQAAYLAQFLLWESTISWVRGVWIYQLKDQGDRANDIEDNFGIYDFNYRPKPASCTVRESIQLIRSSTASRLFKVGSRFLLIHLATKNGPRIVAWTAFANNNAVLSSTDGTKLIARPLCGVRQPASQSVQVGLTPIVIAPSSQRAALHINVKW